MTTIQIEVRLREVLEIDYQELEDQSIIEWIENQDWMQFIEWEKV